MKDDVFAIQKVEAAEAAKSPVRRLVEETGWFAVNFAFGVCLFWVISDTPHNILIWLSEPAAWPDANRVYHPIYEPFKKWMLLAGVFAFFVSARLIAFAKGPRE